MENNENKSNFAKMEEEVLGFWDKGDIFDKSVKREAPKGEYVFYDGPPFATGLPHYGHIVASVMKDAVPRFWTMNGYRVERKWGWDCHGLPIENIVEKELGSKNKSYIEENVGVAKFNELCRANVLSYVSDWERVIRRLGRWADMKNSYRTMDLEYMESIWWVFKDLFDKGLIYEGYRSMHVCPRCETTLSQSEVAEGYADIKDLSATAKFELVDEPGTFVLAWTTTPWTLIGNVALAVGADIDYSIVKITNSEARTMNHYVLATSRIEEVLKGQEYEIVKNIKGTDLIGKRYQPLFGYYAKDQKLENHANGWKIYGADFVTTEDGVGVVHIAPAFGEDDMNLGKKYELPFIQHVGIDGVIKNEVTDFAGLNVKPIGDHMSTDIEIIKYLAHHNGLFSKEKYEHSYPHCWRCDTPLINYATSSWFVNVSKIKLPMLELAQDINWSPQHIKEGRFGSWLEGARDWSISRQRFWASVMPVWRCSGSGNSNNQETKNNDGCNHQVVIGSVKELEDLSGVRVTDLHKHVVDEVTFKCENCGGTMHRIPDVLDTWFDSGSMPYAQMHYPFENKEKFEANFPAEFIAEGQDQCRAWFYYQHVLATGIKHKPAFKNVIVNGIVLAEDGKKMSKKLKNYPDPSLLFDKYGSDALRYYLLTSPVMLAENLNFSEKGVLESVRKVNMILWNVYKFYELFATDVVLEGTEQPAESQNVLDKWILARLNQLIVEVTRGMHEYNLPKATRPIIDFIDDLSTWYIRRSRDRFKGDDEADVKNALATTKHVLLELSKLMAPFTPFIAEQVWQKVSGHDFGDVNRSVHLEAWPAANQADETILSEMERVRKIVEYGLAKRDEVKIKIRQPLAEARVANSRLKLTDEYQDLIKDELNVKIVRTISGDEDNQNLVVELDIEITPELKQEGIKRELVRNINSLRKDANLSIGDSAEIYYETESEELKIVLEKYGADIMNDTLGKAIKFGIEHVEQSKEFKIEGEMIKLGVKKI